MKILLVEDEDPKRRHIEAFLQEHFSNPEIRLAKSVRSALEELEISIPDLLILDMSLPTFDIGAGETGGRPQGFGGRELMRNIELEGINCRCVILTGYEAFSKAGGQVGLDALNSELNDEHPDNFLGMLHYNSAYGDWRERLMKILIDENLLK